MAKKTKKSKGPEKASPLSNLALLLLGEMAAQPAKLEYNTRVLGGSFHDSDVSSLDAAYVELHEAGLVGPAGMVISFFGVPKSIYRISPSGLRFIKGAAA